MKKNIILLGPPGAGKGTQGQLLSKELSVPFISSGDALREEINKKSAIGEKVDSFIKKGALVPDYVIEEFIAAVLNKYDISRGFILDGFPRTVHQADFLNNYLRDINAKLDAVIYISLPEEEIIKRISGRRVCKQCGAVYNIYFNPPKHDMKCDRCGGELVQRPDDKEEVVEHRIKVYKQETKPLIDYYNNHHLLYEVQGQGMLQDVTERIRRVLNDRT